MTAGDCLINGRAGQALAVTDRGLHYGDGLFETLAVSAGVPELWKRHLQRLSEGCQRLAIPAPEANLLWVEAERVCAGSVRAVLKIVITRGSGGRGYRSPEKPRPTRIVSLHAWPAYPPNWQQAGVAVRVCRHRLSLNPALAGLKHLNRLDQVLARQEWTDAEYAEGLMLDPFERVVEGTMSNLFLVRGGRLLTPDLSQAGIAGVMRGLIMDSAAALGVACGTVALTLADLRQADEVFLCNSVIGIWPVQRLEAMSYAAPGPLTARLSEVIAEARRHC